MLRDNKRCAGVYEILLSNQEVQGSAFSYQYFLQYAINRCFGGGHLLLRLLQLAFRSRSLGPRLSNTGARLSTNEIQIKALLSEAFL